MHENRLERQGLYIFLFRLALVLAAMAFAYWLLARLRLAAFAALQRYLARRIPYRRVRKRECPFCGFPATDKEHCEGCGREVVAACTTCGNRRRAGTLHCATCGSA